MNIIKTATAKDTEHTFDPPKDASSDRLPAALVPVSADTVYGVIEVLLRFNEFFRRHRRHRRGEQHDEHGGGAVHAQLRAFCAGLGWHPTTGADVLLDQLGLYAWSLQRALQTAQTDGTDQAAGSPLKETA